MSALIGGRMGRRRYWTWTALILVGSVVLAGLGRATVGVLATILWLCVAIPRLHDIGRSGWWATGVLVFIGSAVAAATTVGPLMVACMAFLGVVLELVLIVWLGVAEPEPGHNRWSPQALADPVEALTP